VRHQFARIKARDELGLWIRHLSLTLGDPGFGGHSVLLGRDPGGGPLARRALGPLARGAAKEHLSLLLQLFLEGQQQPLLLFPQTSRDYQQAREQHPGDARRWLRAARAAWAPDGIPYPGEGGDAEVVRLLGDAEPFSDDFTPPPGLSYAPERSFQQLARDVWAPLLAALRAARGEGAP
jgi:exonuclease V gamma subunit